jgi:hypothetical protein
VANAVGVAGAGLLRGGGERETKKTSRIRRGRGTLTAAAASG